MNEPKGVKPFPAAGGAGEAGVGPTAELSLRLSVGTLARVCFDAPGGGSVMLAFERAATARGWGADAEVPVVAKPFGGGARLTDPEALREAIGDFHYDSLRSRRERDVRLQVRPEAWERMEALCRKHLPDGTGGLLDASPDRELAEEFHDALGLELRRDDYRLTPLGMRVRHTALPAEGTRGAGRPTSRIYFVFEARLRDPAAIEAVLENSRRVSDGDLAAAARRDAERGGRGRANAVLALEREVLEGAYRRLPKRLRGLPRTVTGHRFAGNVAVVLEGMELAGFRSYEP